jgi:LysM repeat protein
VFRRAIGKLLACAIGGVLLASSTALAAAPHTVEPGETLWSIALANNLTTRALAAANGLPAEAHILAGSTIWVPSVSEAASALAGQLQSAGPGFGARGRYVVRPGDSLSAIAARSGVTVQELASLNGLDPTGTLLIGTRLRLPTGAAAAPPAAVHPHGSPLVRNVLVCYQSRCTVEVLRGQGRDDR